MGLGAAGSGGRGVGDWSSDVTALRIKGMRQGNRLLESPAIELPLRQSAAGADLLAMRGATAGCATAG